MALAPYFERASLAAAQVLRGFDPERFRGVLQESPVTIDVAEECLDAPEVEVAAELTVRLASRFYPVIRLERGATRFSELARAINPAIELTSEETRYRVNIAEGQATDRTVFVGSGGWIAQLSTQRPVSVGQSDNPFGAAFAATIGMSKLFRAIFLEDDMGWDEEVRISALSPGQDPPSDAPSPTALEFPRRAALVGAGAVGNAAIFALGKLHVRGLIHVVDPETIEISNAQRYVLSTVDDVGGYKVDLAASAFDRGLEPLPFRLSWDSFVQHSGFDWDSVIVAVDSANVRRQIQASMPRSIVNAWTQPGDLGVSVHPSLSEGACLGCLYLPKGAAPNEDQVIAAALGVPGPQQEMAIRGLLFSNQPPPIGLLEAVSEARGIPIEKLEPYASRPLRELYVEGICGGAVIPLHEVGQPPQDLHVPLPHQSAMAGVLLAAAFVGQGLQSGHSHAAVTRTNVLRPKTVFSTQPVAKDSRGICICQDNDFKEVYASKFL